MILLIAFLVFLLALAGGVAVHPVLFAVVILAVAIAASGYRRPL